MLLVLGGAALGQRQLVGDCNGDGHVDVLVFVPLRIHPLEAANRLSPRPLAESQEPSGVPPRMPGTPFALAYYITVTN